jgi:ABC-type transport system involved in multi-copper enzyme maturation permease subunit
MGGYTRSCCLAAWHRNFHFSLPTINRVKMKNESEHKVHTDHGNHYGKLLIMTVVSFIAMYVLMYAMVNTFSNVFPNVNQLYMAGLMASAMVIIELVIMGSMYTNKKMNAGIMGVSTVALVAFFFLIKQQSAVSDRQFLKSMIPHHAGAILMCEEANIKDPEIKRLCQEIVSSQRKEIAQMKSKLRKLKDRDD